ncbi:MAG: cardiolipin synthase, partial [Firmicutes bacterium]|nr:cardiolipin synthase [Bacillota bacterium]
YDGTGNVYLTKNFLYELTSAGGKVEAFLPPHFIRLNYRIHRKICVIDGEIGYVGGFNIGNEYLGLVRRYGAWRDTHLRIRGDAVDQLQLRFIMDWNFTCKSEELIPDDKFFPPKPEYPGVKIQILSSGPDTRWPSIKNSYFKMITSAKKNIYIITPYFVPDDSIIAALKVAAQSGVDVRLLIPANPDHFFVYWASMSYIGELLDSGIRCFQYNTGFVHAKQIMMDGIYASVGTANMDIRSFSLNLEVNAFIFDKEFCEKLEADFMRDLENSMEITKEWYVSRSAAFRFKERISRLISPVL